MAKAQSQLLRNYNKLMKRMGLSQEEALNSSPVEQTGNEIPTVTITSSNQERDANHTTTPLAVFFQRSRPRSNHLLSHNQRCEHQTHRVYQSPRIAKTCGGLKPWNWRLGSAPGGQCFLPPQFFTGKLVRIAVAPKVFH
jgi:hypothetical protein